jgi:hypothetical protein
MVDLSAIVLSQHAVPMFGFAERWSRRHDIGLISERYDALLFVA